MAAKKRVMARTAKQIAATKKLVALNKKRRVKSPVKKSKKKATSKTKTKRWSKMTTDYYVVIKKGKGFKYFDGEKFVAKKIDSASYRSKKTALRIAKNLAEIIKAPIGVLVDSKKN